MKKLFSTRFSKYYSFVLASILLIIAMCIVVQANTGKNIITGRYFEFDEDSKYEFSGSKEGKPTNTQNTYGEFSVSGDVGDVFSKNGIPAFQVDSGSLKFTYSYGDKLLKAKKDEWHLVEDEDKKIDIISLEEKVMKGAIIVQTSKDQKNWVTVEARTNVFESTPVNTKALYTTQDIQLINGCYYRVIVAYELGRRTEESHFLWINTDKYEYKKYAEVYDFYACTTSTMQEDTSTDQKYNLGLAVRCEHFKGYDGEDAIKKSDPHYGITLGQFFVSGYTDTVKDKDNNQVFLKNVGDKVTLWFKLKENINAIGGNDKVTVTADDEGYDQYFQTTPTSFGRGTLIIRFTDYNNISSEPQIYTNYLEANATVGADTKVSLFEEGDYEVALDYEVTEDKTFPIPDSEGHYRIFFKFSIRNGNCMAYPFDIKTGDELTNSSMTENGFCLNLAKSRYLKVAVKREIMAEGADGLVEDTRFNGPAKDGAEYIDEGIYTITISNQYTNQLTEKKIYVGNNSVLRAYMTTGLSVKEINTLVDGGATINEDGTIELATTIISPESGESGSAYTESAKSPFTKGILLFVIIIAVLTAIGIICMIAFKKRTKSIIPTDESDDAEKENGIDQDGGTQE